MPISAIGIASNAKKLTKGVTKQIIVKAKKTNPANRIKVDENVMKSFVL